MKRQRRVPWTRAERVRRFHLPSALVGALGGAAAAYFADRERGRVRRHSAAERGAAVLRRGRRRLTRQTTFACGRAHGLAHRLQCEPVRELDDATLAHKVESILFRDENVPKGRISINAERGVVFLRGEVESEELIRDLDDAVRAIAGVHAVENLLHVPGTPAPHPAGGARLGD